MGIEAIISKIEEDSNREAERILSEAKKEVKRKIKEAERKAKDDGDKILLRAEREIENWKKSQIAKIKQQIKKQILNKKEEVITESFDRAKETLKKLSGEGYRSIIKNLIEIGIRDVGRDCIVAPSRDEDIAVARELGINVSNKRINAIGGVIIKSEDGKITIDNTFEAIIERKKEDIRSEIGKLLFMEEDKY